MKYGEIFLETLTNGSDEDRAKLAAAVQEWVQTEVVDASVVRKVLQVSNKPTERTENGEAAIYYKLSDDVTDAVEAIGDYTSLRVVRRPNVSTVFCYIQTIGNILEVAKSVLRTAESVEQYLREQIVRYINFHENKTLLSLLNAADSTPDDLAATAFDPSAVKEIVKLLTGNNLKAAAIIIKESFWNDVFGWTNTVASDKTLDQIKARGADAVTQFGGLNIIPIQDRVFTEAGVAANTDGFVVAAPQYLGWVNNPEPIKVKTETPFDTPGVVRFAYYERIGMVIGNTNAVAAFNFGS